MSCSEYSETLSRSSWNLLSFGYVMLFLPFIEKLEETIASLFSSLNPKG